MICLLERKCDPIDPPLNADCDHDLSDVAPNVLVTCVCTGNHLFYNGMNVLRTVCDSRGVWLHQNRDCVGSFVRHSSAI